jgi:hypothetical protein
MRKHCASAAQPLRNRCAIDAQARAIDVRSLRNRSHIDAQSMRNRYEITAQALRKRSESMRNRCAIFALSLHSRCTIAERRTYTYQEDPCNIMVAQSNT